MRVATALLCELQIQQLTAECANNKKYHILGKGASSARQCSGVCSQGLNDSIAFVALIVEILLLVASHSA